MTCAISQKKMPLLVQFLNDTDPSSVERVYPEHPQNSFGASVKFKATTLTITVAPISLDFRVTESALG